MIGCCGGLNGNGLHRQQRVWHYLKGLGWMVCWSSCGLVGGNVSLRVGFEALLFKFFFLSQTGMVYWTPHPKTDGSGRLKSDLGTDYDTESRSCRVLSLRSINISAKLFYQSGLRNMGIFVWTCLCCVFIMFLLVGVFNYGRGHGLFNIHV